MAAEKWLSSEAADVSDSELFQRDHMLLEMWPEARRRRCMSFLSAWSDAGSKEWAGPT